MALLCNVDVGASEIMKAQPKEKKGLNNVFIQERLFTVEKGNPGRLKRFQPLDEKYKGPIP